MNRLAPFAVHTAQTVLSLVALVAVLEGAQLIAVAWDHFRHPELYR